MVVEYEQMGSAFLRRGNEFQQTRIKQLEIELTAAETRLQGNEARAQEAKSRLHRAETLGAENLASSQELEQSQRDNTVAQAELAAGERELENAREILSSQRRGLSLSDYSTNDKPYSAQRHDELEISLTRLREELAQAHSERAALTTQLAIQQERVDQLTKFSVAARQRSQLLSWSAGDGMYVIRGTPLLRLTDCTHVRVVAYVSERVYNRLRVGDAAEIQVGSDRKIYPGKVEVLLGPPEQRIPLSSSLNLPPELRERYAISILSSALGEREQCDSGQSAEVKLQPALGYW
jgi:multidrug resistance efflux pump